MTPPVWTNAFAATAWAAAVLVAVRSSWRHRAMRGTGWLPLWVAQAPISIWWAYLNVDRWRGHITTAEYRDAVAPIVPVVLAMWAVTAILFSVRAARTQAVTDLVTRGGDSGGPSETDNDRDS